MLVLNKYLAVKMQNLPVTPGLVLKKQLIIPKDGRNQINRNPPEIGFMDVIIPKFVFDENGKRRFDQIEKCGHLLGRIERQITDNVGIRILFSHFIAGRRKKGQHYPVFGMFFF